MRAGAKIVVGGVFVAMVAGAAWGVHDIAGALDGDGGSGDGGVGTGPPSAAEVRSTADGFLADWSAGKLAAAADRTDNASDALEALRGLQQDGHVVKVSTRAKAPVEDTVRYTVTARIRYAKHEATLRYATRLRVVRGRTGGKALVDFRPAVLHPELPDGGRLRTGRAAAPRIRPVDRHGAVLDTAAYPSLKPLLADLRTRYGGKVDGTPGIETWIEDSAGKTTKTLDVLAEGVPGKLRTTLDAGMQRKAEQAVRRFGKSAVVAVEPSTGEVLAVANQDHADFNAAFMARRAPGSTFKIVTSTALLAKGAVTPRTPVTCYRSFANPGGKAFHNSEGSEIKNATFAVDFAQSCNTAFVQQAGELSDTELADTASRYFGLGRDDWKTGVSSFDGSVPTGGGDEKAAAMIGQGKVQMSPLDMASVAATVSSGRFRQPVLVARSLDDRPLAQASPLPAGVRADLQAMMRQTVAGGTAAGLGLLPGTGAKTGSAEVAGQAKADSWFTAYRGDVAAAAWVPGAGHGRDAAGPIVRAVIR